MDTEEATGLPVKAKESPALTYHQAIDARIRTLEVELAALDPPSSNLASHEQLRALKSARNATSAACRIPLEVLQEVFLNIQHKPADARSPIGAPWIGFTYVCQYWRNAALGCPALWATITPRQGPYHEEMLDRAGDAPLDVEVTQTTIRSQNFLATIKKALSHTARLRSVTLFLNSDIPHKSAPRPIEWSWLIEPASREEASLLQELRITSPQNLSRLSAKLLGGGAPALRVLSVNMWFESLDLEALPFSSKMTHLTLWHHGTRFWRMNRTYISPQIRWGPSVPSLFEALKATPLLEELTLGITMSPASDKWTEANEATLPALRVLRIQDYGLSIIQLLKVFCLPAVAFVEVGLGAPTTTDCLRRVLRELNPWSSGRAPTPCIPSTSIGYLDISQFHSSSSVWFDALPFGHPPDNFDSSNAGLRETAVIEDDKTQWYDTDTGIASTPSRPSLRIVHSEESELSIFDLLAKEFNIQTLRAFRLVPEVKFRPAFWTETQLLWLPELRTLSVGITKLEQLVVFLRVLEGYMPQPQDDGNLVPLPPGSFPSLKKVSLAGFGYAMHEIKRRRKKAAKGRGVEGWDTTWDIVRAMVDAFKARPYITNWELGTSRGREEEEVKAIEDIRAGLPGVQISVQEQPDWYDKLLQS